jgi:hypothetical protein
MLWNEIHKGPLFGLKSSGHLIFCNEVNKGQLNELELGGKLIICNKINKASQTHWPWQ